jgi:hypothetical protein
VPLLNLQAYPRYNIYLEDEDEATIIIDSEISLDVGVPYCPLMAPGLKPEDLPLHWQVDVKSVDPENGIEARAYLMVNSTGNKIPLSTKALTPSFEPYELDITITHAECSRSHVAKTQIYRLPLPSHGGSVTRLDYLHGGLQTRQNDGTWKKVFPFGFYADWGGYLQRPKYQDKYAALGYNVVSPVPGGGVTPFEPDAFAAYVEQLDEAPQASLMYNMRWTYQDDELVTEQVEELRKHKSVLLWYTADEPGGQSDPLDAPLKSYDVIKKLDPYRPISLVLNCANFHYAEYVLPPPTPITTNNLRPFLANVYGRYTRGADILLTDPYPIAVNTTFSSRWHTPCNSTYGCCGCDNCHGNFRDVSDRLDNYKRYQRWLSNAPLGTPSMDPGRGAGGPKAFWLVPQVFGGSEYWERPPTVEEEVVMVWLGINHGAKGVVGWLFPTTPELEGVMSALAKLVSSEEVTELLLGDNPRALDMAVESENDVDVDVGAWIVGHTMLLSIVYLGLEDTDAAITVNLPYAVKSDTARQLWPQPDHPTLGHIAEPWGETMFKVQDGREAWEDNRHRPSWRLNGSEARRMGLPAMSVSVLIVDLKS